MAAHQNENYSSEKGMEVGSKPSTGGTILVSEEHLKKICNQIWKSP